MSFSKRVAGLSVLLTAAGACASAEEEGGSTPFGDAPPLCAQCTEPRLGGETSDFNEDGSSPCTGEPAPFTPEVAARFPLGAVEAAYAGPFEAPLRWSRDADLRPGVTAFEPLGAATRLSGEVTLGTPRYYEGVLRAGSRREDVPGGECPDVLVVPASVRFEADDGTLAASLDARIAVRSELSEPNEVFGFTNDLSQVRGNLPLGLDPARRYDGRLWFHLYSLAGAERQAALELSVRPLDGATEELLVHARPDHRCDELSYPIEPDASEAALGGRSALTLVRDWQRAIADAAAPVARWRDADADTALSLELGAPQTVCLYPSLGTQEALSSVTFRNESRLTSTDGRVASVLTHGRASEARIELWNTSPTESPREVPVAQFEAESGVRGVEPGPASTLSAAIEARFERAASGVSATGSIQVSSDHCSYTTPPPEDCEHLLVECLHWPASEEAPGVCGS